MEHKTGSILVVDDNEINRDLLIRRLERQKYTVDTASDGREALSMIRKGDFDVILLDIMMPIMDGYQVLEHLKSDLSLSHIPVIVISAIEDFNSIIRCIKLGAEDYLTKPFNSVLLKARIKACLEKKHLYDQQKEYQQAIQRERELSQRIQRSFLPGLIIQPEGWEIAVSFRPAHHVSGDFYDVFTMPNNQVGLVIADVCGTGVEAALFIALVHSLLRAYADQHCDSIEATLHAVSFTNRYITMYYHNNHTQLFTTLFFGILDTVKGNLSYINAGHYAPILVSSAEIKEQLDATGPAVGMMESSSFEIGQSQLEPGDFLVAYTDGIDEARNPLGEFFGKERLLSMLKRKSSSVTTLLKQIEMAVMIHTAAGEPSDDITMLGIRRKPM